MATKLLLVDDREFLRECTKALMATQKDFQIVGDASTAPAPRRRSTH
jgi:DNA-binding NarL/FixJ family response regulator